MKIVVLGYFLVVNMVAFFMMGIDKRRAIKGKWRISEAALFGSALVGGALGSVAGMWTFRHKTKHWYFVIGMPAILLVWVCIIGWFIMTCM